MDARIEKLERSKRVLARIIRERDDGIRYVPVFKRLEEELTSLLDIEDDYDRILRQYQV
ncbi:hypothetical protein [Puniceibacterium sediminis]|uniref:Uncharacterized protein n=1 Tax=Puniceibacterium sediminis TaxID=1608407 RepID=A0A238Z7R3_9RHOB|nr:hypothetical protein [Puniceibacterium sediminis]SNR79515.1 hypothetical protein SAMN06265370_12543 [Puniceibacterium sediminis]